MKFGRLKVDSEWFAWYPVKFSSGPDVERWVWLERVFRHRYQAGPRRMVWQYWPRKDTP